MSEEHTRPAARKSWWIQIVFLYEMLQCYCKNVESPCCVEACVVRVGVKKQSVAVTALAFYASPSRSCDLAFRRCCTVWVYRVFYATPAKYIFVYRLSTCRNVQSVMLTRSVPSCWVSDVWSSVRIQPGYCTWWTGAEVAWRTRAQESDSISCSDRVLQSPRKEAKKPTSSLSICPLQSRWMLSKLFWEFFELALFSYGWKGDVTMLINLLLPDWLVLVGWVVDPSMNFTPHCSRRHRFGTGEH
jgi:hypothetical protein